MKRSIAISNAHPRLRFARTEVARVIHILDGDFGKSPLGKGRGSEDLAKEAGAKRRGGPAVPPGELSIAFLTDPALARIHASFMNDPTATDVITFEGDPSAGLAGEICVSADTAARFVGLPLEGGPDPARRSCSAKAAKDRQAPALQAEFSAELTLYVVHGWLHLAGYDDLLPARKRRMRAAEKRAIALLNAAKVLPAFRLI
jgi:probable rRNA maturation factor